MIKTNSVKKNNPLESKSGQHKKLNFKIIYNTYIKPYKKEFFQIILGLLLGSVFQLILPFLMQAIVDVGINTNDISFIKIILIAQLVLFISQYSVSFIRSWIVLQLSTRVNISMISDFLVKIMNLPIQFFDRERIGGVMERINDHSKIYHFLSSSINTIFSFFTFIVFSIVLIIYSVKVFLIFLLGSIIYVFWILLFIKSRMKLDYVVFAQKSRNQNLLFQIVMGMRDIKLNSAEVGKKTEWEGLQSDLFKSNIKQLKINQYQSTGAAFINEVKNAIIIYFVAKAVLNGELTLGMMLSIQYIIGQMNTPIKNLIKFSQDGQDASISADRISKIYEMPDEDLKENKNLVSLFSGKNVRSELKDVSFAYDEKKVLDNVSFEIPENKVTAVVGPSGSGKTTIVKLLLKFYKPNKGVIELNGEDITDKDSRSIRELMGVVLQDGFLFDDSILYNITMLKGNVNHNRLAKAIEVSNLTEFIDTLENGVNEHIGTQSLSGGQKQRILLARALYKDPPFIILDEATSSLDSINETLIIKNLKDKFRNKTFFIIAHRLSSIKHADNIIVLDKGTIVEMGIHEDLLEKKGFYYKLVNSQLSY